MLDLIVQSTPVTEVANADFAVGVANQNPYSGTLANTPVVPGTVRLLVNADEKLIDPGNNGVLEYTDDQGTTGSYNAVTGEVNINLADADRAAANQPLTVYYSYFNAEPKLVNNGNPSSMRFRSEEDRQGAIVVQSSLDGTNWTVEFALLVPARAVTSSTVVSNRLLRVSSTVQGRLQASKINAL